MMKRKRIQICRTTLMKEQNENSIYYLCCIDNYDNDDHVGLMINNKNSGIIPQLSNEKDDDDKSSCSHCSKIRTTDNNNNNKLNEIEAVLNEYKNLYQRTSRITTLGQSNEHHHHEEEEQQQRLLLLLWKLREFAILPGGYCTDSIRQKVYPILVLGESYSECMEQQFSKTTIPHHNDHDQIRLDVVRSTWDHLPPYCVDKNYELINKKQEILIRYINETLQIPLPANEIISFPIDACRKSMKNYSTTQSNLQSMHYYQGYHDVASVILSIMINNNNNNDDSSNDNNANVNESSTKPSPLEFSQLNAQLLHKISYTHLKDYMKESFVSLQTAIHLTIRPMLWKLDPDVFDHIIQCTGDFHDSDNPSSLFIFALSWMLTWFSHDLLNLQNHRPQTGVNSVQDNTGNKIDIVKRLFDLFIVSHPSMPIYITLAILLHPINKQRILTTDSTDYADIYYVLSQLHCNIVLEGTNNEEDDKNPLGTTYDNTCTYNDAASDTSYSEDEYEILNEKDFMNVSDTNEVSNIDSSYHDAVITDDKGVLSDLSNQKRSKKTVVPVEEIISSALQYMHQIPPYELLKLATEHYGKDNCNLQEWLNEASRIAIFQPLPIQPQGRTEQNWSYGTLDTPASSTQQDLASSILEDESNELTPIIRPRNKDPNKFIDTSLLELNRLICENRSSVAVIAAGFGSKKIIKSVSASVDTNILSKFLRMKKKHKRRLLISLLLCIGILLGMKWERNWLRNVHELIVKKIVDRATIRHTPAEILSSPVQNNDTSSIKDDDLDHKSTAIDNQSTALENHASTLATVLDSVNTNEIEEQSNGSESSKLNEDDRLQRNVSDTPISRHDISIDTSETANRRVDRVNFDRTDSLRKLGLRQEYYTGKQSVQDNSNESSSMLYCPTEYKRFGCNIAGRSAQLLCLTDGTQVCRPIQSDGSIDLFDLVIDEVAECGPCQTNNEDSRYAIAQKRNRDDSSSYSNILTLRCPLEYGSCGKEDSTVLICDLNRIGSKEESHTPEAGRIALFLNGRERCLTAAPVLSTLYEVSLPVKDSCPGTECSAADNDEVDSSQHICGCCDGFDPDIDSAGKCPSQGDSEISSTSGELEFNKCCHPCRSQVPIEYRPCCCFMTTENENKDACSDSNSWLDSRFGYENCRNLL